LGKKKQKNDPILSVLGQFGGYYVLTISTWGVYRNVSNMTNFNVVQPKLEQKSKLFEYFSNPKNGKFTTKKNPTVL
jgi:hypothetical protein